MNENKELCKPLRKEFSKVGWALLIYYGIMNLSVLLVTFCISLMVGFQIAFSSASGESYDSLVTAITNDSYWGYALAVIIGFVALMYWEKPEFCRTTIWEQKKSMTWGSFFALLAVFISGQALYQLLTPLLEWLFSLVGISLEDSIAAATGDADSFSLFLYVGLLAPIWEEILFRGFVMRRLQPFGKKFAIIASALLFGLYHANVVQSPYAFAVGLVLGYVAMEYSVLWAMVLHMINNLTLSDTIGRLVQNLPVMVQEITFLVLIWGCALAAVVILICKHKAIAAYWKEDKNHPLAFKAFFTNAGVITLMLVLVGLMVLSLFLV